MVGVKVLVKGAHEKVDGKLKIGSSVTLIKSDKNIIVDTGSFTDKDLIIEELKKEGLAPEEIDIVVLTHTHLDHMVNTYLFTNAKVYCKFRGGSYPGQYHMPKDGCLERAEIKDGVNIAEDVEFILTPGHTEDMISVVAKTIDGVVVIAGDAISSEDWTDLNKQPELVYDMDLFNESRKKILEIADCIVPGHGKLFNVVK